MLHRELLVQRYQAYCSQSFSSSAVDVLALLTQLALNGSPLLIIPPNGLARSNSGFNAFFASVSVKQGLDLLGQTRACTTLCYIHSCEMRCKSNVVVLQVVCDIERCNLLVVVS